MRVLTRAEAREIDRHAIDDFGIPGVILMENAGRGVSDLLLSLGAKGPVVICCGKGNNGGDGFVIARHRLERDAPTRVLLFAPPEQLTGDAAANYHILIKAGFPVLSIANNPGLNWRKDLSYADWIVDALFGTGLMGAVRGIYAEAIEAINACSAQVLAVDIPSGLDCDTGLPLGPTVRAHHTATFLAPKVGFANPASGEWLGKVHVLGIGLPEPLEE